MGGRSSTEPSAETLAALEADLPNAYAEAARHLAEADVLLLCTGAGFSADSGLAVYADVARIPAYASRGLQYHDICRPHWQQHDPELFWGFWGQCFNDYRETAPHDGYAIINSWAEDRFRKTKTAELIRQQLPDVLLSKDLAEQPYIVTDKAGAFFVFTSNVDAHHFDWFHACEIRDCHGNVELYQCTRFCKGLWRAPMNFAYCVDKETMLAPAGAAGKIPDELPVAVDEADTAPKIGRVHGDRRTTTVRNMRHKLRNDTAEGGGFDNNHPECIHCGSPARPAILMFGDDSWDDFDAQHQRWEDWLKTVTKVVRASSTPEKPMKVVVIEVGAGGNVPTVRGTSERSLLRVLEAGADAHLIRVNPDLPLPDHIQLESNPETQKGVTYYPDRVISIPSRGLAAIREIDARYQQLSGSSK